MVFDVTCKIRLASEFQALHPELRALLVELDHWSTTQQIRKPLITCLRRSAKANAAIYAKHFSELRMELLTSGAVRHSNKKREVFTRREVAQLFSRAKASDLMTFALTGEVLSPEQRVKAASVLSDVFLQEQATARQSRHTVLCAADIRSHHYTGNEETRVLAWLSHHCKDAQLWELVQDAVSGPNIHIARKDPAWAQQHKFETGGGNV